MLGPRLHIGHDALLAEPVAHDAAQLLGALLAADALLVQQAGHIAIGVRLQKAERQILHLPLDLPDAQPVGQWCQHMQRLVGQRMRHRQLGGGVVAQRLQARSQPQQDHAQVAREGQQHLAHRLDLFRLRAQAAAGLHTLALLQPHQARGLQRQLGIFLAKGLGDHFLRAAQVVGRIHQVGHGLQRGGTPHLCQDVGHAVGMLQLVLAGRQLAIDQQRPGELARLRQDVGVHRQHVGAGLHDAGYFCIVGKGAPGGACGIHGGIHAGIHTPAHFWVYQANVS